MSETQQKLKKIAELENQLKMHQGLPHLYGDPWYQWQHDFFSSVNRYNFLVAANQVGKSSCQIRKMIHWATEPKLWPKLWRKRPLTFWYLYPSKSVATVEVLKKWTHEFLPRNEYKEHPQYGWRTEIKNKEVFAIHFKTGVSCFTKTYAQDVQDLQTGTVSAVFCDEELPYEIYPEINMRLSATNGFFHMVFTATLGQIEWEETMEHVGLPTERFKGAFKRQVSLYDCLEYMDGTKTPWTEEMIEQRKNYCGSEAEVLRRIYGRFVKSEGLKYPSFSRTRNVKPKDPIPSDWQYFAGVDVGSGGAVNHPAAIAIVAVAPDMQSGRVVDGWRGDGIETSAADVLMKYMELTRGRVISGAFYDWASAEFGIIASRNGVPFQRADKGNDKGESTMNVLFKNQMLTIDDFPRLTPLVHELCTLSANMNKTKAKDDFIDALRYAVTSIPWDFSVIQGKPIETEEQQKPKTQGELDQELRVQEAIEWKRGTSQPIDFGVEREFEEWQELYE